MRGEAQKQNGVPDEAPPSFLVLYRQTHTHTFILDKSCADVHLDASPPAKGVWGTAGSLQVSGIYQYSKEAFLNRTGWEKKGK